MSERGLRGALAITSALALVACGSDSGGGGEAAAGGNGEAWQPNRPITYIIPYGTGGSTDPIGRQFASQLSEELGVEVIVENREGAAATIGTTGIVTAQPDCYTLGLSNHQALANQAALNPDLPFQTTEDYTPLVKLGDIPVVLAVNADTPWQTLDEFIAAAEADPNGIGYATSGAGGTPDTNAKLLEIRTGVELNRVPFSGGGGEALTAAVSGEIESIGTFYPSMQGFVESGDLRPLGVFYDEEYPLLPDLPLIGEEYEGVSMPAAYYTIAPTDLDEECRDTLVEVSERIVTSEEFRQFAEENGYVVDPIQLDDLAQEIDDYRPVFAEIEESDA
ncbi:tripartite tricarboxylate transporter substrate binding protein [Geodermatophilus sp. DSM 44513]|uniref:Bug family tripartite tricarboxylate transporter substrate binding protein n=1 Tax=Geodermatophilus sp. DSM 44513 TaxID=1528104 RepID=UPI00127FB622|nr:tripartite tricarboxylate transporter substrate binding protein [Geodermatophilus sp. DSM 44513]WNV74172.1 tripartite tricarboxylate transporter substrate binding protein [Geodermatophilus sp. DSM 44513]